MLFWSLSLKDSILNQSYLTLGTMQVFLVTLVGSLSIFMKAAEASPVKRATVWPGFSGLETLFVLLVIPSSHLASISLLT